MLSASAAAPSAGFALLPLVISLPEKELCPERSLVCYTSWGCCSVLWGVLRFLVAEGVIVISVYLQVEVMPASLGSCMTKKGNDPVNPLLCTADICRDSGVR